MSETTFILLIHHGGRFNKARKPRYIGGKVTQVCDNLDIDKLSYPEIMSYVKEDLGYELESIAAIYYFKMLQGEFICVQDDHTILEIASRLCSGSRLEFYVDHRVENIVDKEACGAENIVDDEASRVKIIVDEEAREEEDIFESLDDVVVTVAKELEEKIDGDQFEENEKGMEDLPPQQTFDNLNVNVDFLTDDDDEKLQQSRNNVKAMRMKNTFRGNQNISLGADSDCRADLGESDAGEGRLEAENVEDEHENEEAENVEDEYENEEAENGEDEPENEEAESDKDSTGSFYYDSDDNCSYYSETDEECGDHALRRPNKIIKYDTKAAIPTFCCGMVFNNIEECKDALAKYAILKGLQIHLIKNDKVRVRAGCMPKCPWSFFASKDGFSDNFIVKTYKPNHKCHRKNTNPMASSKYLAKHLKERLMSKPFITIKYLKGLCKNELKLRVSMTQARNIRKRVIADLLGTYTEEYKRLHDYVHEINTSNPGTTCVVKTSKEGGDINHFNSFYVCFAACKRGWMAGCRKIIGLDGCFLKGVCKGQLLCAIGRDGNNQMFLIAWAVVAVENKENWGWFLSLLKHDLLLEDGGELTIMSDMQKGLDSAIREILPQVEHRMCARHVYAAWAKKWRGEERKLAFWNCARSTFEMDFKANLQKLNLLGDGIVQDLVRYGVECFSKAYFKTFTKCDVVDNNMAETFNGWILEARCKPIISMLEDIRTQVMRRLHIKRRFCGSWICEIGPRPMEKLEKNKEQSYLWEMAWNGDDGYEVPSVFDHNNRHTLHLNSQTCTCREWDLTGIPCQHAICAIYSEGKDPKDYMCHWYTEGTYMKAYQFMMQPVKGKHLWAETGKEDIAPQPHRKLPGRPKLQRRKDKNEIKKKLGKQSKKGVVMTCSICKQETHNKRKCPQRSNNNANASSSKAGKRKNVEENEVASAKRKKKGAYHVQSPTSRRLATNETRAVPHQVASTHNRSHITNETGPVPHKAALPAISGRMTKEKKTITKKASRFPPGYGCYVDITGASILNPGTRIRRPLLGGSMFAPLNQAVDKSSQPQTSRGLKWKGKAAMTTGQLQAEAQRKTVAVINQAKGKKGCGACNRSTQE